MACVFITMLILLADIWGSILVMICVTMTLVNVMGYMHFWGQTIDVVSSVIIIISIGLCVDYSAHIAHAFLSAKGKTKIYYTVTYRHEQPNWEYTCENIRIFLPLRFYVKSILVIL